MDRKLRYFIQHGHVNETTFRCDITQYHYWSGEGRKIPFPRRCTCQKCKDYRAALKKQMLDRIKQDGKDAVLKEMLWNDMK